MTGRLSGPRLALGGRHSRADAIHRRSPAQGGDDACVNGGASGSQLHATGAPKRPPSINFASRALVGHPVYWAGSQPDATTSYRDPDGKVYPPLPGGGVLVRVASVAL